MSPDEYCRNKLASVASSAHYSLLFLPDQPRRAATALYALRRELDEAVGRVSDPSLAHAGLHWWAQEIGRLFEGAAQHPGTRALAPDPQAYDLAPGPVQQALEASQGPLETRRLQGF